MDRKKSLNNVDLEVFLDMTEGTIHLKIVRRIFFFFFFELIGANLANYIAFLDYVWEFLTSRKILQISTIDNEKMFGSRLLDLEAFSHTLWSD